MKKIVVYLALAASAFAAPALSFAQSSGPLTRAEVRADLVRVEQAGYNPALASDPHYPDDIQAAEAKVAAEQTGGGFGGVQQQRTSSGAPARMSMKGTCVGPAGFCTPYFGS
ncbi:MULTISPECIES: DUF4148 domain-containing protein [unclassified Caballeronia]|uniref:DUF4148 domain-containing protein n=1 Tax=unclassified Caballeronia TaxID=2646786 RepID=UPI0028649829|nr:MULTISPECIES: DUF4148 domain-containing protein [unclassified Caballeronia]MDR5739212.1 DUF4148 domain-containing protein [Caballeronia sp. LZ016]MDR5807701.1 DUF4148 domain-containing protein [Caballeronia sp. LZ019]